MDLKICWLYHDIMDLYGDKGNMLVLRKQCDLSSYDILFLGGGADKEQMILISDLLARKDNIQKAMEEGSFVLLICGGYQLFGQYYINAHHEKIEGLKFFDYYTDTGENGRRCIGDIAISCDLDGNTYTVVGFENHGGQTKNVNSTLGKVLHGFGNSFEGKQEGFYNGKVLATYMHGPLLPKNPEIADFVIYKGLKKRNPNIRLQDLQPLDDTLELKAKQAMLKRLNILK